MREHRGNFRQCVRPAGGFALGGEALLVADIAQESRLSPTVVSQETLDTRGRNSQHPSDLAGAFGAPLLFRMKRIRGVISESRFPIAAGHRQLLVGVPVCFKFEQPPGFGIQQARSVVDRSVPARRKADLPGSRPGTARTREVSSRLRDNSALAHSRSARRRPTSA